MNKLRDLKADLEILTGDWGAHESDWFRHNGTAIATHAIERAIKAEKQLEELLAWEKPKEKCYLSAMRRIAELESLNRELVDMFGMGRRCGQRRHLEMIRSEIIQMLQSDERKLNSYIDRYATTVIDLGCEVKQLKEQIEKLKTLAQELHEINYTASQELLFSGAFEVPVDRAVTREVVRKTLKAKEALTNANE